MEAPDRTDVTYPAIFLMIIPAVLWPWQTLAVAAVTAAVLTPIGHFIPRTMLRMAFTMTLVVVFDVIAEGWSDQATQSVVRWVAVLTGVAISGYAAGWLARRWSFQRATP